jgi:hypothetical protein
MPLTNVASGQQTVGNAAANLVIITDPLVVDASATSLVLDVYNLSRLTWHIEVGAGGLGVAQVQPEVAFRRGAAGNLIFVNAAPAFLTPPAGAPAILHINTLVVQAMRCTVTHVGAPGDPAISVEIRLTGSA